MKRIARSSWVICFVAGTLLATTHSGAIAAPAPHSEQAATERDSSSLRDLLKNPGPVRSVLEQRAVLPADFLAEGPPSGADVKLANGVEGPFDGQVIPGFSGIVDNGDGSFWGLPDNGFGSKENSSDFLLRLYRVTPQWETANGGSGEIDVEEFISLRDPDEVIPFPIVNDDSTERLLTGGDFDIESVARARDGSLYIGEEFGPFLLHVDDSGKVLEAPIEFTLGSSPQNPLLESGEEARVPQSRGFEAMPISPDQRALYPIVEGAFTDDDEPRRRVITHFDVRKGAYSDRTWDYRTDADKNVIGDAVLLDKRTMLVLERDDTEGAEAVTKRLYVVNLQDTDDAGFLRKRLVTDLLDIANPDDIGAGKPEDGFGLGDPFSFPLQSVETLSVLADGRILVGNDNNYPGSNGRVSGKPDDTELIVLRLERAKEGPLVIAHRGASGYRPEHTLEAYELAIQMCADYIEPDLVSTSDGVLVARHENEISGTTDVADRSEFADRKTTKEIDGVSLTGWFTEDFTLEELKTLRAIERIPDTRPENAEFDGQFQVPTFQEVIDLAQRSLSCDGEEIGMYPETKHPSYFDGIDLSLEEPLVETLTSNGYSSSKAPVYVQSFEVGNLKDLSSMTKVNLVQLIGCQGAPFDLDSAGEDTTYADLLTAQGMRDVARYAEGIGPCKDLLIPRNDDGTLAEPTGVLDLAAEQELEVHAYTFRAENSFLPTQFRSSQEENAIGDLPGEIRTFVEAGMTGYFTDQSDIGARAARELAAD